MSANTNIEWTDATWNPVEGCSMAKGSEAGGCLNCYAARSALRRPDTGLAMMRDSGPRWTGKVQLVESRLEIPLHWKKPRRVFVNSMSDLFHESLNDEDILRVMKAMDRAPWHTYQVLTKRPDRMRQWMRKNLHGMEPRYLWLGVSIENFPTWDARVHLLKDTPAAVRFVSYEPALQGLGCVDFEGIDWVIIGGESGPGARPFDIAWAKSTIEQCRAAGVACFVKQAGGHIRASNGTALGWPIKEAGSYSDFSVDPPRIYVRDRKGGDPSEWPEWMRVREFPK